LFERDWLENVFQRHDGRYPELEQIWKLMDEPWRELNCDPEVMDDRISAYYSHPVWLLNGLFIEQHHLSVSNRKIFTEWVANQKPARVADYGGGFGTLARMIGNVCPAASVEVIEPHPHPAAIKLSEKTSNVRYCPKLTGKYDILIATDVFEHVPDPVALVADTACMLRPGGQFLIANCFAPVILCHLPQTFHFRSSWEKVLKEMGLIPGEKVAYGRAFARSETIAARPARLVEIRSQKIFNWTYWLPERMRRLIITALL
jgi:2-polyprenyl-3-methyl-5-hydroxy-6-metoxy-1,4-benzoquinol methylase